MSVRADRDMNGTADHELDVHDGRVVAGRRDLDEDGVFETTEVYGPEGLEALVIDTTGDGRVDYVYEPLGGTMAWDLDEDGFLDIRRYIVNGRALVEDLPAREESE